MKNLKIYFFGSGSTRCLLLIKISQKLKNKGFLRLSKWFLLKVEKDYSCYISSYAKIGNVTFPHPTGIVIGAGSVIENNVTLYQQVTIGAKGGGKGSEYPSLRENVIVYSGAKVLGGITIGRNSIVGANAVVLKNVPDNHIAVGIPATNHPINKLAD